MRPASSARARDRAVEELEAHRVNKLESEPDDAAAADIDIDVDDREVLQLADPGVPELERPAQAVRADRKLPHAEVSVDASLRISEGTERKRIEDALDTDHLFVRRYLNVCVQ
jgi:hypothetical protein